MYMLHVISCALCHAHTYPPATQADLCLYQLQCMCKCTYVHTGIKDFLATYGVAINVYS